jgi:hypothetical protein
MNAVGEALLLEITVLERGVKNAMELDVLSDNHVQTVKV